MQHTDTHKHTYAHHHACSQLSQAAGRHWDGWPRLGAGFEDMQENPSAYKVRDLYPSMRNQGRRVEILLTFFPAIQNAGFSLWSVFLFWHEDDRQETGRSIVGRQSSPTWCHLILDYIISTCPRVQLISFSFKLNWCYKNKTIWNLLLLPNCEERFSP